MGWRSAALSIGVALLCSPSVAIAQTPQTTQASDVATETGVIDGATFRIDMPKTWNKGLVVINHGYSPEPRIPQAGPPSARLRVYLDRGFAVAQSSYSKGGWAIEQALTDNVKMMDHFTKKHGKPTTVIATGGAMGASVTTASIEKQPEIYDAGLVTCCSGLDARLENMNWNFEMLALFDYYFPGVMPSVVGPLNGMPYSIGNSPAQQKIQAALDASPEKAEIFRRAWGRKKEDVASTVAFHSYLIHEAQERSGGNPFSNETTIYFVDDDITAVNKGVKRHKADPGANAYLKTWYTATGTPQKPLFILQPIYDPIVPADTTEAYMALVRRNGGGKNVAFQIFDHYGHGSITTAEVAAAFDELLAWMKGGPKPKDGDGIERADPPRAGAAGQ